MKNLITRTTKLIALGILYVVSANSANAQFKVNANGSMQLHSSHWTGGLLLNDAIMPGNFGMSTIYPASNWWGALGTWTNEFGFAYIDHIYAGVYTTTSDMRLKKNIKPMGYVLPKINSLNAYTYNYKISPEKLDSLPKEVQKEKQRERLGLMAQEVQEVFPQLVYTDDAGMMSLDYDGMIPILLEAIKEQQVQISSLQYQINKDKKELNQGQLRKDSLSLVIYASYLEQNTPNPFNTVTEVKYYVPDHLNEASIMIFDMAGNLLRTYKNVTKGNSSLMIEAGELNAGMFMYSLIVDGVELDSKRMILTK